jgi:hypothetical protein
MNAPRKPKTQDASTLTTHSQKKTPNNTKPCGDSCACSPETTQSRASQQSQKSAQGHTKIVVKCNCGFPNNLYIRGEGVKGLSWDKGSLMKCTKADEWIWETDTPFQKAQIKVLINDKWYEAGDNHVIDCGKSVIFQPRF